MKAHFLLFPFTGSIGALIQPQLTPAKVTLLRVEAHAFGETQDFTVTNDSILVDKRTITENGDKRIHYARAVTSQEHDDLLSSFNNVYLSSLKTSYEVNDALTDDMTFDLFIHKGETVKYVRIYKYKLAPLYTFSKKLNRLLPPSFRIEYTDGYFSN